MVTFAEALANVVSNPENIEARLELANQYHAAGRRSAAKFARYDIEVVRRQVTVPAQRKWCLLEREALIADQTVRTEIFGIPPSPDYQGFTRLGFFDELHIATDKFLQYADELFASAPITALKLHPSSTDVNLADVLNHPKMRQIKRLHIDAGLLDPWQALGVSRRVKNLDFLCISQGHSNVSAASLVFNNNDLKVRALSLEFTPLDLRLEGFYHNLSQGMMMRNLEALRIHHQLRDMDLYTICGRNIHPTPLKYLSIMGGGISAHCFNTIAPYLANLPNLQALMIDGALLQGVTAGCLLNVPAAARHVKGLCLSAPIESLSEVLGQYTLLWQSLALIGYAVDNSTLVKLASLPGSRNLKMLSLAGTYDWAGINALAQSEHLRDLESLTLATTQINTDAELRLRRQTNIKEYFPFPVADLTEYDQRSPTKRWLSEWYRRIASQHGL